MNASTSQRISPASAHQPQSDSSNSHHDGGNGGGHDTRESPGQSFISSRRFLEHLRITIQQSYPHQDFDAASLILAPSPFPSLFGVSGSARIPMPDLTYPNNMDRPTEERLLSTFLESYQVVAPILDASWLWQYHESLWSEGDASHWRCPLIDILLALAVHQVVSLSDELGDSALNTAAAGPPGYYLFERSQISLLRTTDAPNLRTVQSYLYASIYMGNLHQDLKAHQMLAMAVRNAFIIGLPIHQMGLDCLGDQSAKMTWLALQILDVFMSTEAGMPFLLSPSSTTNTRMLIIDQPSRGMLNHDGLPYLECFVQLVELSSLVRECAINLTQACTEIFVDAPSVDIFSTDEFYSIGTPYLKATMKTIHAWFRALHPRLKSKVKEDKDMEVDPEYDIPMWLHRQRLLLQMSYHMTSLMLLRPYACVGERVERHNINAAELSIACSKHASALTTTIEKNIDSGLFNILSQATRLQWLATLCLTGYITTHPTSPHTLAARKSLATSVENFDNLSRHQVPQAKKAHRHSEAFVRMTQLVVEKSVAQLSSSMTGFESVSTSSSITAVPPCTLETPIPEWPIELGSDWTWPWFEDYNQWGIE